MREIKDFIIEYLKEIQPTLQANGIVKLGLFGSVFLNSF